MKNRKNAKNFENQKQRINENAFMLMPFNWKIVIIKAVYAAFVPILTFVLLEIIEYQLNLFGLVILGSGVLFTIPFYITAYIIKRNPIRNTLWYFLFDIANVTSIGIFTSLILDIINILRFGISDFSGITTALLSLIYLLINLSFMAVNKITLKKYKGRIN